MNGREKVGCTEDNHFKSSIKELIDECNDFDLLYLINSLLASESGN